MKKFKIILISLPIIFLLFSKLNAKLDFDIGENSYPNFSYVHHYPDPVSISNLNFYFPNQDLFLPCFGFPLEIFRAYNSLSLYNGPFGLGWTFNYDIRLFEHPGKIIILEPDGYMHQYLPSELQDYNKKNIVIKIIKQLQDEHKKKEGALRDDEYYKKAKTKLLTDISYYEMMKDRIVKSYTTLKEGEYVSEKRGKSSLLKRKDGYIRTHQNGKKEYFNKEGKLIKIVDRNKNTMNFRYKNNNLSEVTDPCKRKMTFKYNDHGKITSIVDPLKRKLTYKYDRHDRMREVTDLNDTTITYDYNEDGKHTHMNELKRINYSKGEKVELIYEDRIITEERGPGSLISKYESKTDPNDKNHQWRIITNNTGYWKRYDYYRNEYKTMETEKSGKKVITTVTACCGSPMSVTDEKGVGVFFQYDPNNNLRRRIDVDGKITEFSYEDKFQQIKSIVASDGAKVVYHYDNFGNLKRATDSNGNLLNIKYERHGKIEQIQGGHIITKESKKPKVKISTVITFAYNFFGKPDNIEKKGVGKILVKYKPTGDIVEVNTIADKNFLKENKLKGSTKDIIIQNIRGSIISLLALLKPTGISMGI